MLQLDRVTARYDRLTALKDISLTIGQGEMVGVFGHNGAGKTTLLKCGVGAHKHIEGVITVNGERIIPGEVHRNVRIGIGFVPQGRNVFGDLSVEQNLKIAGLMHDPDYVSQVYKLFPILEQRRRQRAGTLSGGQQQMLALGMALMTKPKILLLDEPTTGLAPIIVKEVLRTLREINRTLSTTIVIVEQNVRATLKVVQRAIVLKSGRLVFDGPSDELGRQEDLWALF
ncbi:MAG TPA: ABC transporter ATP-binding protein [Limnochordales bacterium]